jgi:fructuronate reductase
MPVRVLPTVRAQRADGRLPTGALRVLAAWINHLRGAGAPVKDGNAELLAPLAKGPLDQAVPRILDYLDPDLAADAAVVSAVADLCRQLDQTPMTNSREGNRR